MVDSAQSQACGPEQILIERVGSVNPSSMHEGGSHSRQTHEGSEEDVSTDLSLAPPSSVGKKTPRVEDGESNSKHAR